jgi:hypothetical protein
LSFVDTRLKLLLKDLDLLDELFEFKVVFVTGKVELVSMFDEFFGTREVGLLPESELLQEGFLFLEGVDNPVNFGLSFFNSFL